MHENALLRISTASEEETRFCGGRLSLDISICTLNFSTDGDATDALSIPLGKCMWYCPLSRCFSNFKYLIIYVESTRNVSVFVIFPVSQKRKRTHSLYLFHVCFPAPRMKPSRCHCTRSARLFVYVCAFRICRRVLCVCVANKRIIRIAPAHK